MSPFSTDCGPQFTLLPPLRPHCHSSVGTRKRIKDSLLFSVESRTGETLSLAVPLLTFKSLSQSLCVSLFFQSPHSPDSCVPISFRLFYFLEIGLHVDPTCFIPFDVNLSERWRNIEGWPLFAACCLLLCLRADVSCLSFFVLQFEDKATGKLPFLTSKVRFSVCLFSSAGREGYSWRRCKRTKEIKDDFSEHQHVSSDSGTQSSLSLFAPFQSICSLSLSLSLLTADYTAESSPSQSISMSLLTFLSTGHAISSS